MDPAGEDFIFRRPRSHAAPFQFEYRKRFGRGSASLIQPMRGCAVVLCDGYVEDPEALEALSFRADMASLNIFVLAEQGEISLRSQGESYAADKNQAILVQPGSGYDRTRDISWAVPRHKYAVFLFDSQALAAELSRWGFSTEAAVALTNPSASEKSGYVFERDDTLDALSRFLWKHAAESPLHRDWMKLKLAELSLLLGEKLAPSASDRSRRWVNQRLDLVRSQLDIHFAQPPELSRLARLAGMSTSRLSLEFHQVIGMTIRAYVQDRRMEEGRRLITSTSLSIGETAHRCGYKHQGNFSRAFKERYGVLPKALRSS